MDLAEQSILTYMPDTNCFRYKAYDFKNTRKTNKKVMIKNKEEIIKKLPIVFGTK